jgi:hypothetical protein
MPSRMVDLFTCRRAIGSRFQLDAVWKIISPCLMWCIWRERNDQNFDRERTWVELNALFFKTLFHWDTFFYFNISSFHIFSDLFSTSS